jgi:hypothetical protein
MHGNQRTKLIETHYAENTGPHYSHLANLDFSQKKVKKANSEKTV